MNEFEKWLEAKGFKAAELGDAQKASLKAMWEAEQKAEPDPPDVKASEGQKPASDPVAADVAGQRKTHLAETHRLEKIDALCAEFKADIEAKALTELRDKAVNDGWDENKTEVAFIRASRPKAPQGPIKKDMVGAKVLEAAVCIGQALLPEKDLVAAFGANTMEEAYRFRGIGLRQLCEIAARMAGRELPVEIGSREYMQAAFSTTALSGIVGNVANKALQKAFTAMNPVTPKIAGTASHANFHSHTVYSMVFNGDMEEVGPDGDLKHLKPNEESYTRQVTTKGAMLRITRTDIINDELGAFTRTADAMSRKAIIAREKALFTLINASGLGASHFTSARANYFSGAATNLQLTSLGTAVQMFRDQTGPDGDPVLIEPKILLVPSALEETGKSLMDRSAALIAVALGSTSAEKRGPSANVWAGQFEVVQSPYLGNSVLTGYSATAWYLLADPADMPCFEVAYLNGNQAPVVEYFGLDSDPDNLGVTWRVYWDFGVANAEYRAGVKSKGAA